MNNSDDPIMRDDYQPYAPPKAAVEVVNEPRMLRRPERSLKFLDILRVFFNPRQVLDGRVDLDHSLIMPLLVYISGIAVVIDRIDAQMIKSDLSSGGRGLMADIAGSWLAYWGTLLGLGLIGALLQWALWGWWYSVRVRWSGYREVSTDDARRVYVLTDTIISMPMIVMTAIISLSFTSYAEYWAADDYLASAILIFAVLSCVNSWIAVRSRYPLDEVRAAVWFLILPLLIYGIAIAGIAVAYYHAWA